MANCLHPECDREGVYSIVASDRSPVPICYGHAIMMLGVLSAMNYDCLIIDPDGRLYENQAPPDPESN